jgi:lipoate-protein ligase A
LILVNPEEGARKQIEIYKGMAGVERLKIAFEMWEIALAKVKAFEKSMNPGLDEKEIERWARQRMTAET